MWHENIPMVVFMWTCPRLWGATTSSASALSSSPPDLRVWTMLLPPHCYLDIRVGAKRSRPDIFIFDFPGAVLGENGCKAKHQMDKLCETTVLLLFLLMNYLILFSPSPFVFLLFLFFSPLPYFSSFYSLPHGHKALDPDVCTLCSHVLSLVIIQSRFSVLIVVHPVFWECSSIGNSRNKGFPSWLQGFPLSLQEFQGHPRGCWTPETQRSRWVMEKQSGKSQGEKRRWICDCDGFKRNFIGPGLRYWHSWKLCCVCEESWKGLGWEGL